MYICQDPIGLEGGTIFYGYVFDNNIWIDVFGLSKKQPIRYVNNVEIIGTGQNTGGKDHASISEKTADKMAKSGKYKKIGIDVAVSTVTGVSTYPKTRPDVTGVRLDGKVDIVEVPSPTDKLNKLKQKEKNTLKALGNRKGTYRVTKQCKKK